MGDVATWVGSAATVLALAGIWVAIGANKRADEAVAEAKEANRLAAAANAHAEKANGIAAQALEESRPKPPLWEIRLLTLEDRVANFEIVNHGGDARRVSAPPAQLGGMSIVWPTGKSRTFSLGLQGGAVPSNLTITAIGFTPLNVQLPTREGEVVKTPFMEPDHAG